MKPAINNNTWLGIQGETIATLYNAKGDVVGYCLDAPNPVAYAMKIRPDVVKATGLLGEYKMADIKERKIWIMQDADIHSKQVKFIK